MFFNEMGKLGGFMRVQSAKKWQQVRLCVVRCVASALTHPPPAGCEEL